jgi:preprotein translocase subunit SecG
MEQLLLVFYVVLSAAIVALILLQQGRGADMGASFGAGASQTVFGSAGAGNLLSRSTAILATLFFVASVGLAMMAKHKAEVARMGEIPLPPPIETRDNVPASRDAAAPATDVTPAPQQGAEFPQAPASEQPPAAGSEAATDIPAPPAEQPPPGQ